MGTYSPSSARHFFEWLDFSAHIFQELGGSEVTVLLLLPKTSMYLKTKVQEPPIAGDRDSWSS